MPISYEQTQKEARHRRSWIVNSRSAEFPAIQGLRGAIAARFEAPGRSYGSTWAEFHREWRLVRITQMVEATWRTSRSSLLAAINELEQFGLIVKTRQGSRLDCSLFAVSIYPLACDLSKLDVGPGAYLHTDYACGGELRKH
jgi:hypothetical protein